jgi:hypothetical protein
MGLPCKVRSWIIRIVAAILDLVAVSKQRFRKSPAESGTLGGGNRTGLTGRTNKISQTDILFGIDFLKITLSAISNSSGRQSRKAAR